MPAWKTEMLGCGEVGERGLLGGLSTYCLWSTLKYSSTDMKEVMITSIDIPGAVS